LQTSNIIPLVLPKRSNKINLTKSVLDKLPYAQRGKQQLYWDAKTPGFGLLVGFSTKTFIVQRDIKGKTRRITIDKFGIITPEQGRVRAKEALVEMGKGHDPNERKRNERAKQITLREAVTNYREARKNLSEKTGAEYSRLFDQYLLDWMNKPLADITPDRVAKRHTRIADQIKAQPHSKTTGGSSANGTFVALRAVYNHALAINGTLPPNPVKRLSATKAWYPEKQRTGHIKPTQLKPWLASIGRLPNDVQRDYIYLVLLTGLRRNEAATIGWKDVDLEGQTLHIPVTKNKRTLNIPLSNFLTTLLTARKARCGDSPWVFPAHSKSGHIEEPRFALNWAAKECDVQVTVHDLRRTFITVAESCEVPHYVFKALVNHSTAGDVTGSHYVQMSVERMRPWMEKISESFSSQLFS